MFVHFGAKLSNILKFKLLFSVQCATVNSLKIIKPHYRSEGRRQVSGGVFGGCMALSEDNRDKCHEG